MVSALTVLLLSCWLAGHSGTWGQREFPKPLVGGSPRWVVAPGENVSIRCEGRYPGMEFLLRKAGHPNMYQRVVSAGTVAEFPLPSVGRADAGSYTCEYRPITEPTRWSHLSDPVEITVAEPSAPKPNISLRPSGGVSLGASVSIRCRGPRLGRQFVLKTARGQFLHKDPDGYEAEFPLSSLHREQGGSYSCSYHSKSEPFTVSYPSDPVELVLRDYNLPRPSISVSPTGVTAPGADITIRCQGPGGDVRFFLHQAGDLTRPRPMDPAGDGAEFHICPVGQQHGGSYSCSYRPRTEPFVSSYLSSPVELVVAGETDLTQPGAASDSAGAGFGDGRESDDSEQSGSDGLSTPLIAGVSVAAIGLLLLLLAALVCFVRTRARKGDAPRCSSTIPLGALKAPAQQDPLYASVDEGKQPQSLPQEPDPDGLTYAELDHQALQAKRGAPAPEPVLYAAVSGSRGAPP